MSESGVSLAYDRFREHRQTIRDIPVTMTAVNGKDCRDYYNGDSQAITLKSEPRVIIFDTHMKANTVFPAHEHVDSTEVLIIYEGHIDVHIDGEIYCLKPGTNGTLTIPAGQQHRTVVLNDSYLVAIVIPREEVFNGADSRSGCT